jgi:hypothetical protein
MSHKDDKRSLNNILILFYVGFKTYERLVVDIKYDPVTLAAYTTKHDWLGRPSWKKLQVIAHRPPNEQRDLGEFYYDMLASKHTKGLVLKEEW